MAGTDTRGIDAVWPSAGRSTSCYCCVYRVHVMKGPYLVLSADVNRRLSSHVSGIQTNLESALSVVLLGVMSLSGGMDKQSSICVVGKKRSNLLANDGRKEVGGNATLSSLPWPYGASSSALPVAKRVSLEESRFFSKRFHLL